MVQCRICISHCDTDFVSLLDENSENGLSCYGTAVLTFANVSINPSDNLPKVMCNGCVKLLKHAIHFKLTCEKNYKALLEISKKTSNSVAPVNVVDRKIPDFVDESDWKTDVLDTKNDKCDTQIGADDDFDMESTDESLNDESASFSDTDDIFDVLNSYYSTIEESPNFKLRCEPNTNERPRVKVDAAAEFDEMMMIMENNLEAVIKEEGLNGRSNIEVAKTSTCQVCSKVLSSKHSLAQHMQRHGLYPYICEHCGKGFASKSELRYHLFNKHQVGAYIQCDMCDYKTSTTRKFDMMEHRRIHTGERPFACEECGLTFRRREILRGHMKCHTGKVIKCPECPKQFCRQRDVGEHMNNVHKRMFVFSCPECGVHYAKSCTVRRHLADKHGIAREKQGRIPRLNLDNKAPSARGRPQKVYVQSSDVPG